MEPSGSTTDFSDIVVSMHPPAPRPRMHSAAAKAIWRPVINFFISDTPLCLLASKNKKQATMTCRRGPYHALDLLSRIFRGLDLTAFLPQNPFGTTMIFT